MDKTMKLLFGGEFVEETIGFIDDLKSIGEDIAIDVLSVITGELAELDPGDKQEEAATQ